MPVALRFLKLGWAGAALFLAVPCLAEETRGAKAGLPQLDTTLFPAQLFWLALSFALLYLLMARIALPRVQGTQDKRKSVVTEDIAAAAQANEAAKDTLERCERGLAEARLRAQGIVQEVALKASREAAADQERHQQEWDQRVEDAENTIEAAREAAELRIRTLTAELASSIVEKTIAMRAGG